METNQILEEKEKELNGQYKIIGFIKIPGFNVYSAINAVTNYPVAIQEVSDIFEEKADAKRAYNEIKLFKSLNHDNITRLKKIIFQSSYENFNKFYIVTELFNSTLNQIIFNSKSSFTVNNRRFIMFQILNSLKYLHSANIVVKSMSPKNLFIDSLYNVKFLLFGIEEFQKPDKTNDFWYKAPEIFFLNDCNDSSVDIWSVGCIFYSLITKKVLFKGNTLLELINLIVKTIGNLNDDDLSFIDKKICDGIIDVNQNVDEPNWKELIPNGSDDEIDLIKSMLVWNPSKRISVDDALKKHYFNGFHYFYDIKTTDPIDMNEVDHFKIDDLKQKIWNEIQNK